MGGDELHRAVRSLRTGLGLTLVALILASAAATSSWWPAKETGAAQVSVSTTTGFTYCGTWRGRQRQWDPALAIRRANSRDPALPNWDGKLYVLLQLISYGEPISSLIAADEGIALSARLRHRVLPHIALSCCLYMAAARKASTVQRLQVLAVCPRLAYESS